MQIQFVVKDVAATMFWSLEWKMIAVENVEELEIRVSWRDPLTQKITENLVRISIGTFRICYIE